MVEAVARPFVAALGRRRFGLLLGALVALLLAAPILGYDRMGEADAALLFSVVVLAFAWAAKRAALASALAALWLVATWARPFGDGTTGELVIDALMLLVCLVTIESALRRALLAGVVDAEALCAATAAYLLVGIAWASAYAILEALQPGSFVLSAADAERPWSALLYFSFTTLTTLGYGDVLPATALARAWAVVEAICGTIYLAILIARLVGNYSGTAAREKAVADR